MANVSQATNAQPLGSAICTDHHLVETDLNLHLVRSSHARSENFFACGVR